MTVLSPPNSQNLFPDQKNSPKSSYITSISSPSFANLLSFQAFPKMAVMSSSASPPLPPGFRFHPTDEELILYYLCKRAAAVPCPVAIIADINIYNFNPWDLPAKAKFGEREWYFFSPRDRKYPNGVRPNRAAASGYWKATGTDKPITTSRKKENIGVKKALVFYMGKPPKGIKTNWIMHEYRLAERRPFKLSEGSMRLDDLVLCRIYQKTRISSLGEQDASAAATAAATKNSNAIQKSLSVSDFLVEEADFSLLSEMLEKPANSPLPSMAYYEPIWELNLGSSFANNIREKQAEASVFASEHSLKRQRTEESNCFDGSNPTNNLAQFLDQFGTYG